MLLKQVGHIKETSPVKSLNTVVGVFLNLGFFVVLRVRLLGQIFLADLQWHMIRMTLIAGSSILSKAVQELNT